MLFSRFIPLSTPTVSLISIYLIVGLLGTVKGELLPAEVVETPKQPLWNQIYMGDVLLKLNDFLLFDNEDFVNLRIEIKEKVALTILPLSPMRSFLRTE